MTGQAIWKAWKRVAGPELDHFAAHQLRNTFANELARRGTNLNSVRRLMRHASLTTTQRYLDDDEELERDAVRALDGLKPEDRRAQISGVTPYTPEIVGLDGKAYPEPSITSMSFRHSIPPDSTPEPRKVPVVQTDRRASQEFQDLMRHIGSHGGWTVCVECRRLRERYHRAT